MRLTNETDEIIVLAPGESLDFKGDIDEDKPMAQLLKRVKVKEITKEY